MAGTAGVGRAALPGCAMRHCRLGGCWWVGLGARGEASCGAAQWCGAAGGIPGGLRERGRQSLGVAWAEARGAWCGVAALCGAGLVVSGSEAGGGAASGVVMRAWRRPGGERLGSGGDGPGGGRWAKRGGAAGGGALVREQGELGGVSCCARWVDHGRGGSCWWLLDLGMEMGGSCGASGGSWLAVVPVESRRQCRSSGSAAVRGPAVPVEPEPDEHDELQRKLTQEIRRLEQKLMELDG
ncbi:hypothetical protein QYE76_013570 [Lolium multiflorum]|uniref:Uncharacterized protein n=1 Tax=Lolium multiflorum TaxID=4521 RepID=A0AAD8X4P3_LOLMU|nr:hypothetical protein QYE76_013570 [Lolium multiflorum]